MGRTFRVSHALERQSQSVPCVFCRNVYESNSKGAWTNLSKLNLVSQKGRLETKTGCSICRYKTAANAQERSAKA